MFLFSCVLFCFSLVSFSFNLSVIIVIDPTILVYVQKKENISYQFNFIYFSNNSFICLKSNFELSTNIFDIALDLKVLKEFFSTCANDI